MVNTSDVILWQKRQSRVWRRRRNRREGLVQLVSTDSALKLLITITSEKAHNKDFERTDFGVRTKSGFSGHDVLWEGWNRDRPSSLAIADFTTSECECNSKSYADTSEEIPKSRMCKFFSVTLALTKRINRDNSDYTTWRITKDLVCLDSSQTRIYIYIELFSINTFCYKWQKRRIQSFVEETSVKDPHQIIFKHKQRGTAIQ